MKTFLVFDRIGNVVDPETYGSIPESFGNVGFLDIAHETTVGFACGVDGIFSCEVLEFGTFIELFFDLFCLLERWHEDVPDFQS